VVFLIFAGLIPVGILTLTVWHPRKDDFIHKILFNRRMDSGVFLAAIICLFWKFSMLGDADFCEHRKVCHVLLVFLAAGAIWKNYGFLAVRGIIILQLIWASAILQALLDHYQWWALMIKTFVYIVILESLYLAIYPYRLRDWWTSDKAREASARR
jgi:hypothetical protein